MPSGIVKVTWTSEMEKYLIDNHSKVPNKKIAIDLGINTKDVNNKLSVLRRQGKVARSKRNSLPTAASNIVLTVRNCKQDLLVGETYIIKGTEKVEKGMVFKGVVTQVTDRLFILRGKNYSRSFTHIEIATGQYELKEAV